MEGGCTAGAPEPSRNRVPGVAKELILKVPWAEELTFNKGQRYRKHFNTSFFFPVLQVRKHAVAQKRACGIRPDPEHSLCSCSFTPP